MTEKELLRLVTEKIPIDNLHPLHVAVLEKCCEVTLKSNSEITDQETLVLAVQIAFLTSNETLRSTLNSSIKSANAD